MWSSVKWGAWGVAGRGVGQQPHARLARRRRLAVGRGRRAVGAEQRGQRGRLAGRVEHILVEVPGGGQYLVVENKQNCIEKTKQKHVQYQPLVKIKHTIFIID